MRTKKRVMTAFLPATPCTPEMRDRMVSIAEEKGKSLAELQREALTLFFSQSDTDCIQSETKTTDIQLQEQAS